MNYFRLYIKIVISQYDDIGISIKWKQKKNTSPGVILRK